MKLRRALALSLSLASMAFALPVTATASTYDLQSKSDMVSKKPTQAVFVIEAKAGELSQDGQNYTLTLANVDNHVSWFAERPYRMAGQLSTDAFFSQWHQLDGQARPWVAPNVIMLPHVILDNSSGSAQGTAMALSNPEPIKNGWRFDVTNLSNADVVGKYTRVTLFINNPNWCGIQTSGNCTPV